MVRVPNKTKLLCKISIVITKRSCKNYFTDYIKIKMAQTKHVLKFSAIVNYFASADETKLIQRGENAVESNHVEQFMFDAELLVMKGKIHASMRDRLYDVEVYLDKDREIEKSKCSCPRGQFICHHVAALCIYGHHNIAITDVQCQWAKRKPKQTTVKSIDEIYQTKLHQSTNTVLSVEQIQQFRQKLSQTGVPVGFTWLLAPEPSVDAHLLVDIEDFLFSDEYLASTNKGVCFVEKVQVDDAKIKTISEVTVGQANNQNWLICRKNRLTASNFGVVLAAIKRNRYPPSLFRRLTGFYNLDKVSAVQWGRDHEMEALEQFKAITSLPVTLTGLWLHQCGFLGASPDGLVEHNCIVEIKCPYQFRSKMLKEELKANRSYIVYITSIMLKFKAISI